MNLKFDLEKELLERLECDGPIDVAVTYEEYKQHLEPKARVTWNYPDEWHRDTERQAFFLLFLRGYSFFRELSANENDFWSQFPFSKPQNEHYDALEKTLKSDRRIQGLFVTHQPKQSDDLLSKFKYRNRRAFVTTIDNIWGIRSLNAKSLEKLFRRYYFNHPDQEVTKDLIRLLLWDENAEIQDRAVRQSTSYNRIFQGLYRAIQTILENQIETQPLETLSDRMRVQGFVFDDPNPIEFFRNKAQAALEHLLRDLRGQVKPQKRSSLSLTVEDDGTEQKTTRCTLKKFEIVRFPNGVYQYDERIMLEFDHLPSGMRRLELTGVKNQQLEFSGNSIRLPILEVGETTAQVFINNEPATRQIHLKVLPKLEWQFFDHRGEPLKRKPIEGKVLIAQVSLEDGQFKRFRWKATWDERGVQTMPFPIQIELDEQAIEAELIIESHGVRLYNKLGEVQEILTDLGGYFKYLPETTSAKHRVYYASNPENVSMLEKNTFSELESLRPEIEDELLIEREVNSVNELIARYLVRFEPNWITCNLRANMLELQAIAPIGSIWEIFESDATGMLSSHTHDITSELQIINLRHPWRMSKRSIKVRLKSGLGALERAFEYLPDWQAFLEYELNSGLGYGSLKLAQTTPS